MSSGAGVETVEEIADGCPVIGGAAPGVLFPGARPAGWAGRWQLVEAGSWLIGRASAAGAPALAEMTEQLYREMFAAIPGRFLARVWNYVPAINAAGADGLENYRAFSLGRSLAFEAHHGAGFKRRLPASSAVGTRSAQLTVVFVASRVAPRHYENPAQVPAYEYPPEYGPRPPSFARGSVVSEGHDGAAFISGTSAITGHATIAAFDTAGQLRCTLANLREIARACGLGSDLAAGRARERHFRVYLRRAEDYAAVAAEVQSHLCRPGDHVGYLLADICRRELNVEIEATLLGLDFSRGGSWVSGSNYHEKVPVGNRTAP